ncbi:DNA replication initiation control protein YabA [Levilactobacillus spicheri]|uniref:Replication initiation control protein YabA n=2 Tax=Levilactobacillus spicheri TaxID=216463 RepID=A0A0F3RTZ6_9LACO|nr:DNA replication initiation control protein YabA [Levilactobacillus spicheri]KJW13079.1 initiation-control protein [Levilactobacillus spicheri]KRL48407.1 regulator of replication initiation timing [Levilactobacillus spicheri DSM 15429]GEO66643.1 initiation-control protein YabA [Levilactobacillus spicheri]
MDKQAVYDQLKDIKGQLDATLTQFADLQAELTKVFEQNAELEIENQHLRDLLRELQKTLPEAPETQQGLSKSRQILEKLYEEGFHVCREFYGTRRKQDEECAFCLEVIYRDQ